MLCAQCAHELEDGAAVCTHCGGALIAPAPVLSASGTAAFPFSSPTFATANDLEGIGGWLILVAIGLVLSPFVILGTTARIFLPLLNNSLIPAFLQSHPGLRVLLFFEMATNVIFVLFLIALNILFFTKRRSFPTYFVFFLVLQLVVTFADTSLVHVVLPSASASDAGAATMARTIIGAAVWIPYMLVSQRVKATFVR